MARSSRREEVIAALSRRRRERLSLAAIAAETGIPLGTLSWWSWKLRRDEERVGFVEVSVADHRWCADSSGAVGPVVVATPRGTRIEVPGSHVAHLLPIVLDVVEQRC